MRNLKLVVLLSSISFGLLHAQSSTPQITGLQSAVSFGSQQLFGPAITSGTNLSSFALYVNGNFSSGNFKKVTWTNTVTGVSQDFDLESGVLTIGSSQIVVQIPAQGPTGSLFGTPVATAQGIDIFVTEAYFIETGSGTVEVDVPSNAWAFTLNPPLTAASPTTLPAGTVGVFYSANTFSGGTSPYTVSLASGTGPTPVPLQNSPALSGIPALPGLYTFTLNITDEWGNQLSASEVVEIVAVPTISLVTPNVVPVGTNGVVVTVTGTGFVPPTTGLLPDYLGTTLYIVQTNSDVAATPLSTFVVNATTLLATIPPSFLNNPQLYRVYAVQPSSASSNSLPFTVSAPAPQITGLQSSVSFGSQPLLGPAITSGTNLSSFALYVNGNFSPSNFKKVTWTNTVTGVSQDFGVGTGVLTLGNSQIVVQIPAQGTTGSLFRTPVATAQGVNIFVTQTSFTQGPSGIIETDVTSNASVFTLNPPLTAASPTTLPTGGVGVFYSANTFSGGTPPYTVTLAPGSGPTPVPLQNSPILSGTPSQPGTYTFTLNIRDEWGNQLSVTEVVQILLTPTISLVTPNSVPAGTNGVVVTVTGTNFVPPSTGLTPNTPGTTLYIAQANAAATPLSTLVVNATTLQATIPASFLSSPQIYNLFASQSGFASSNSLPFTVVAPTITAVAPNPITARPTPVAVTVTGTGFLAIGAGLPAQTTIMVNGTNVPTAFNSATTLSGSPTLNSPGIVPFQVMNPGGTLSNIFNVTVLPTPAITSVTPNPFSGGTLTVNGVNFSGTMTVLFNGIAISTGFVSAARLTGAVPSNLISGTSAQISVRTADGYVTPPTTIALGTPLQITTASIPAATGLQPYDVKLAATGGATPYNWSASGLPAGLSINTSTGEISGTPTVFGNFTVFVNLRDSNGLTATAQYSLSVSTPAPPPQLTTGGTLPNGFVGVSYNVTLTANGGNGAISFGQAGGTLPPGLVLDSNGVLRGLPTTVGTYTFSVVVTDADGFSSTGSFTLVIKPQPLSIITSSPLLPVTVGSSVNVKFTAFGGVQPYTFSGANLPPGTSIAADGTLSGTATTLGTFQFTVTVADNAGSTPSTKSFSLTVSGLSLAATGNFPDGQVGVAYSAQVGATGGVQPYTITVAGLPAGLNFTDGGVSGTPTAAGKFTVTVTASDSNKGTASQSFTFTIAPAALIITTTSLPNGTVNVAYSASVAAIGGSGKFTFTIGGLPAGVTGAGDGTISGTPTATGSFSVSATVTDTNGATASKTFAITIAAPGLNITTTSLANATVGTAYSATLGATGGVGTLTWSASGLPSALTISAGGIISGTVAAPGGSSVAVTVKDSLGTTASQTFTLTAVLPTPPPLTVTGLPTTSGPASQSTITIGLGSPFPVAVTVNLTLTFAADSGPDDPTVQFATGGRTAQLTIPAGSTTALTSVGLQTGTVAGVVTVTARLVASGQDVTPTPAPTRTVRINSVPPVEVTVTATATSTGFTVTITGFATARRITQAIFTFAPAAGVNLQTTSVTIPVDTLFSAWYASSASAVFGSQFIYTQPFTVTGGSNAVVSVTVTLVNADGSSIAVTATVK